MVTSIGIALFWLVLAGGLSADEKKTPADKSAQTVDAKRDVRKSGPTADNQTNTKSDVKLAAAVRRAIVKDKTLSTSAHNVKVIAENGGITLRGQVDSDEEIRAVAAKAKDAAGGAEVKNELTTKAGTTAGTADKVAATGAAHKTHRKKKAE